MGGDMSVIRRKDLTPGTVFRYLQVPNRDDIPYTFVVHGYNGTKEIPTCYGPLDTSFDQQEPTASRPVEILWSPEDPDEEPQNEWGEVCP